MAEIFKKCEICDNILSINISSKATICNKCLSEFDTSKLLDDNDKTFIKSLSSEEIENSLKYNALILQGNENIADEQFDKAEESFKQAVELNENRYEAYLGIARAKTHDFTFLPDTNDYLEYAKIAISLSDDEIDYQINAKLAKIAVFKNNKKN